VPSASPRIARALVLALCVGLLGGAVAGCQTTQQTAALRQARAKRILAAREERRERREDKGKRARGEKHER
jgi:hypothetical protein